MDVLNLIALFTEEQKNSFINFTPAKMIISKNNGKFNRDYDFDKDQKLGLYCLNNKINY